MSCASKFSRSEALVQVNVRLPANLAKQVDDYLASQATNMLVCKLTRTDVIRLAVVRLLRDKPSLVDALVSLADDLGGSAGNADG